MQYSSDNNVHLWKQQKSLLNSVALVKMRKALAVFGGGDISYTSCSEVGSCLLNLERFAKN